MLATLDNLIPFVFTCVAALLIYHGVRHLNDGAAAYLRAHTDTPPPRYRLGAAVALVGLSTASLNGEMGHVIKESDAATGRIAVKLLSGREIAVKPENVVPMPDEEQKQDADHRYADQKYVDQKHAEAVAAAVSACADDTKRQTCYICTEAVHWKTKEGLVRECACRGTAGFAHVSCLAEQAQILVEEAEEKRLGVKDWNSRWARWYTCNLCKQSHIGAVRCALGWACWRSYVRRSEADTAPRMAMTQLGNGLQLADHFADAVSVYELELSTGRRVGAIEAHVLLVQGNLAGSYAMVGRVEESLRMRRDVYAGKLRTLGQGKIETLMEASNYAYLLGNLRRFEEARLLLLKVLPVARRVLGDSNEITLRMRVVYGETLYMDDGATRNDLCEAVDTLDDSARTARRVFGGAHRFTVAIDDALRNARSALSARDNILRDFPRKLRVSLAALSTRSAPAAGGT